MAAFKGLLITSDPEGSPNTLAEAWRTGTPVLAKPEGAIHDLEQKYDRVCAGVAPGASPASIAVAI